MGQEMLTLSGTPGLAPYGEFMSSHIHCIYHYGICHSEDYMIACLRNNDFGLLAE